MVSVEEARRLGLALPEAVEQDHHGRPSFRVAGKIFATLWDEQHLMSCSTNIRTAVTIQRRATRSGGQEARCCARDAPARGVEGLAQLLTEAWELRGPKRLL